MRYEITEVERGICGRHVSYAYAFTLVEAHDDRFCYLCRYSCIFFAGMLMIGEHNVAGAKDDWDLFWFSVQTLSTIGYGDISH